MARQPEKEMVLSPLVARQLMLMRIHKDDPRLVGNIARDVAELVRLRHHFVRKHKVCWWTCLSRDQMSTLFNVDLTALYVAEYEEIGRLFKRLKNSHSIFRIWSRDRFGHIKGIRTILQEACSWNTY